jgi:hypothetical protein
VYVYVYVCVCVLTEDLSLFSCQDPYKYLAPAVRVPLSPPVAGHLKQYATLELVFVPTGGGKTLLHMVAKQNHKQPTIVRFTIGGEVNHVRLAMAQGLRAPSQLDRGVDAVLERCFRTPCPPFSDEGPELEQEG